MPLSEIVSDLSALGGIPLYGAITVGLFIAGRMTDAFVLALSFILAYGVVILARSIWFRPRPRAERYTNFITKFDANSFISIHAARAAILAAFVWTRTDNVMMGVVAVVLAVAVASLRVSLRRHHTSDVIVGLAVGVIVFLGANTLIANFL